MSQSKPEKKGNPRKSDYLKEANAWECDRISNAIRSSKIAWYVAGGFGLIAALAVIAVMLLTPLKQTEPYLVRVDNTTGKTDIVTAVKDTETLTYEEALDRYWVVKYLKKREGYFFPTIQQDYKAVMLMSTSTAAESFSQYMNPKLNENSPVNRYRDTVEMDIEIQSISFIKPGVAIVRFIKTMTRASTQPVKSAWVATVQFKYMPQRELSDEQRYQNPLGFTVGRYRVDPEVIGE